MNPPRISAYVGIRFRSFRSFRSIADMEKMGKVGNTPKVKRPWPPPEYCLPSLAELERLSRPEADQPRARQLELFPPRSPGPVRDFT